MRVDLAKVGTLKVDIYDATAGSAKRVLFATEDWKVEQPILAFTDDELAETLKTKGYPIARRTVAKYRNQHLPYRKSGNRKDHILEKT